MTRLPIIVVVSMMVQMTMTVIVDVDVIATVCGNYKRSERNPYILIDK